MASLGRSQCPNCLTPYAPHARFCTACGRARDESPSAAPAAETTDPNRSVMLVRSPAPGPAPRPAASGQRRPPPRRPTRTTPAPGETSAHSLPTLSPGVAAFIAIVFFGLVWLGRWVNAPKKPTHPVVAPIAVVTPDPAEARRTERQLEAKEKQDLREAEEYADGLRAQSAADQLQAHLRNAQAPPPSADPKPYDVIQVHPVNGR